MNRRGVTQTEWIVVTSSLVVVTWLGASAHRQLWNATEFLRYRSTVQELTTTVRSMRAHAIAQRRVVELRIDASRGCFRLASIQERPDPYEMVERTIWLPAGLEINDAPRVLTVPPSGRLPAVSIVIAAPSYHRLFRLTTDENGRVQLDEESAL